MRNITIQVFGIDELSEESQQRALNDFIAAHQYSWSDQAINTLITLAEHFDSVLDEYSIYWDSSYVSHVRFKVAVLSDSEISRRLNRLKKSCCFTGVFTDNLAIKPMRKVWDKKLSSSRLDQSAKLSRLLDIGANNMIRYCQDDYIGECSMDYFMDVSKDREWEYTANGKRYLSASSHMTQGSVLFGWEDKS